MAIVTTFRGLPLKALAGALCAGAALHCANAAAINLQQAYEAALAHDPAYRAAYFANEAAQENRIIGRANLLPNLALSYGASKNRSDIDAQTLTHPLYYSRSANLSLRQPLVNLEGLARYRQGVAQSDASAAAFDGQRQEVVLRVAGAYVEALFAEDQAALVKAQRDMYLEQKKLNERLFAKGEGTRTDMLETQARLDLAEAELLEAIDSKAASRTVLAGMIGGEVGELDGLKANFQIGPRDALPFAQWQADVLANNPELRAQAFGVEAARQEINKARAGHAPRLDLVAAYSKSDSDTINTLNQRITNRSIGVQLNIPLYAGGAVNAATRQATANHERAKAETQATSDKWMVELRKGYDLMVSGVARIEALDRAVASGQALTTATQQSIKGGIRINLDLLNAQSQLYQSQRDLAKARFSFLLGNLRLRAAAGNLSAEDVTRMSTYFR